MAESDRQDLAAISSAIVPVVRSQALAKDIQNNDNNYTRFICIAKDLRIYPGSNRISLMLTAPHEPGVFITSWRGLQCSG